MDFKALAIVLGAISPIRLENAILQAASISSRTFPASIAGNIHYCFNGQDAGVLQSRNPLLISTQYDPEFSVLVSSASLTRAELLVLQQPDMSPSPAPPEVHPEGSQ